MNEEMISNELQTFVDAVHSLIEIDEETLTDEMMVAIRDSISASLSPDTIIQPVNQIINNLEQQGSTKAEAIEAVNNIKSILDNLIYGQNELSGHKKELVDMVMQHVYNIFDSAAAKYHSYNIELPMTVDVIAGAKVPTYAHDTDAAADLYAMNDQIFPAHSYGNMIHTGVKIQLPEGWLAMIMPRSSIGTKTPLRLSNSVGLIDSGYRGELGILYDNTSDNEYKVNAGDRIAQLLVMPSYRFQAKVVDALADSDRGEGGFGASGK